MRALLFASILLIPTIAKGQLTPTETIPATEAEVAKPETPATPTETPAEPEAKPVDAVALITSVGKVIDDWRNVGWLAGVIALVNLLLNLLRFKPIDMALERLDWKWLKPLIATLLGALLGGFSTFSTGASVLNSIVAGMLAGLGSIGFHELVDNLRKQTRKPPSAPILTTG